MKLYRSLINGCWKKSKKKIVIINPANQNVIGQLFDVGADGANEAIIAAHNAFKIWSKKSVEYRSNILKSWYKLIIENKSHLAKTITMESGKPLKESIAEVLYGASFIQWFAEQALRVTGEIFNSPDISKKMMTIKQPIGVVTAITPWNFPVAMVTRKTGAAIASGCTVVLKPSELTPISSIKLGELAVQAGIPKGVLNIVNGFPKEIGKILSTHPLVKKITFTGSTKVGKYLMKQASSTVKSVSLELGGNAPFIVFDDADIENSINGLIDAKFRNAGQTCIAANRIFVHKDIQEVFLKKLLEKVSKLKVGNGLSDSDIGPLINNEAVEKVQLHINDAIKKGAKVIVGGQRTSKKELFYAPTILVNINSNMKVFKNENFGPVVPIISFSKDEELIDFCNNTNYGLAAYFYTKNSQRVWKILEDLEFGMFGINTGKISSYINSFGGLKESGIGREGSIDGLESFLEKKFMSWDQG